MVKRTPLLGFFFAAVLTGAVLLLVQEPERPFTLAQHLLLFGTSFLPGLGLALLLDPRARAARETYLAMDFYREEA